MTEQQIVSLEDLLWAEDQALATHRLEFAREMSFADIVLRAAQDVFRQSAWQDRVQDKCVAGLVTASIRYYASSCSTVLRGHVGESLGLMRCAVEAGAYALKIHRKPELAVTWLSGHWKERTAKVGRDTTIVREELGAGDTYSVLSEHGIHARAGMSGRGTEFAAAGSWRFYFGDLSTPEARFTFFSNAVLMKDLVENRYVPAFWPTGAPESVSTLLSAATEDHQKLAVSRRSDMDAWQLTIDKRMREAAGDGG